MSLPITHVATTDLSDMLNPEGGRRMKLPGFDAEFVDFPDYIIRITDRIWHDRDVDLCAKYYTDDCLIHTLTGQIIGAQTVIDNTHATLKSFPDRVLDADNVIWSDEGDGTLYSSHLITSKMTNLGPSEFGPPTGKKVRVRTIADCAAKANKIFEEWLVRDYAAMVIHMLMSIKLRQSSQLMILQMAIHLLIFTKAVTWLYPVSLYPNRINQIIQKMIRSVLPKPCWAIT